MAAALLYCGLYLLTLVPGLPLGRRLFGRATPLGWVAGALMGYALTSVAFWVPAWLGWSHPIAFFAAWFTLTAGLWRIRSTDTGLVSLPAWTHRDTRAWLALMLVVMVFVAIPFRRVGEADATGARNYRAYFTADFVWHMALTQELGRFEFPPTNPYLAPEPIHYYWTYFMVPAVLAGPESSPLVTVETALKLTAAGTAFLMFSVIFLSAWSATGRSGAALAACLVALMAPSWEGLYVLWNSWRQGLSPAAVLELVRGMNIDAVTAWQFHGLRMDGLVRSMWWTPQHATSFTLGLLSLVAAARRDTAESSARVGLTGLALALSVAMNPFLGAAFCLSYGLVVIVHVLRQRMSLRSLLVQALAIGPVAVAVAWTVLNQMGGGASDAVLLGWRGLGRNAPVITLVLSLGGLLVPAALCLWPWRTRHLSFGWVALPAAAVGLTLGWFVSLASDPAWVGFRTANILQATLPMLAACGFAALADASKRAAVATLMMLVAAGAPTTLIDTFNAQDIENRTMGPGFRWTIPLSRAQQDGFRWIRRATPASAIVQADPVVRGRENWSVIPSFAGRRMAAGDPISLLATPDYQRRSAAVHEMLTSMELPNAHTRAEELGVNYVWVDQDDDPDVARRLASRPDLFGLVFRRAAVHVFDVRPGSTRPLRVP